MQLDQPRGHVFGAGVDDGIRSERQRLLEAVRHDVDHDDVRDAAALEAEQGPEADRARAEDRDPVLRRGVEPVDRVAGDRHRFVERGHAERHVRRDDPELLTRLRIEQHHVLAERALRAAGAEQAVDGGHDVDDDVVADGDALDLGADLDDLACRFVPERRRALARRDAAIGRVHVVGAADAAGAHAHEHVARAGGGGVDVDDGRLAGAGHQH